ncbi:AMP-binding protein [Lysinibacillus boronitolerans]|uniref:AMP-binding protein n=1 Tax=Lysinibacillus boronitolerans TaxID=309788 RepID=UPI0005651437|nr:AMP-binding protein [Lysinibacillus boronitolerans]MCS1392287.1 AMP-binding protein [Lysinibacillus boronitolerans]
MKQYKEQPLYESLRQHAKIQPHQDAIIYYGKRISYKELDELSDRFAVFLQKQGITKGDKVALYMQNCPQYIICSLGIQKIGAIEGPCSPMFKEWELEYEIKDLGAKAIVTLDHLYSVVRNIKNQTDLEHIIVTNYIDFLPENPVPSFPEPIFKKEPIENTHDLNHILQQVIDQVPIVDIDMANDISLIVYTSGSTGLPKGAMLSFGNAFFKTKNVAECYGFRNEDIHLSIMPMCHIAGKLFSVNVPLFTGGTIVVLTRYTAEALVEVIETYKISVTYTVTPMNVDVMNLPNIQQVDFSTLKINQCTSFGIPLTEDIMHAWTTLTNSKIFEISYGSSETHTADTLMPLDDIVVGGHGKPIPGSEIRIVNPENTDEDMALGQLGEILIKSPAVFKGYLNKPEATKTAIQNGWLHTGDIGFMDERGHLFFQGRRKELIKCSGYSVFPEDVEVMLVRHPAVNAAAVIGVPDAKRGETVKAFIVLKSEYVGTITEKDIIAWSKEKMASYKYPRSIEFREVLPQTATGKLLRRVLVEEELQQRKGSKVNG